MLPVVVMVDVVYCVGCDGSVVVRDVCVAFQRFG
jgi:hypothetical protein